MKTDVIVNSTSASLNLNWGSLSKLLNGTAGPVVQNECSLRYPNGINFDQIAVTSSGNIKDAKFIFHVTVENLTADLYNQV